jgi:HSP20 family molecular chaperone IbpA
MRAYASPSPWRGFPPDDIAITAQQFVLTVAGRRTDSLEREYVHPGFRLARSTLSLADHVEVERATFETGLLQIDLVRRSPESLEAAEHCNRLPPRGVLRRRRQEFAQSR